jgi:hypothetical protein
MPIVGAVLTLAPDPRRATALQALSGDARVTFGELAGDRVPVVVETRGAAEDEQFWKDLYAIDGVLHASIVYAALEDELVELRKPQAASRKP